jgi:hypothetical protein
MQLASIAIAFSILGWSLSSRNSNKNVQIGINIAIIENISGLIYLMLTCTKYNGITTIQNDNTIILQRSVKAIG